MPLRLDRRYADRLIRQALQAQLATGSDLAPGGDETILYTATIEWKPGGRVRVLDVRVVERKARGSRKAKA